MIILGLLAVGTAFAFDLPDRIAERPSKMINSVINSGEGEVNYRPETSNIVANKTIITKTSDEQVGLSEAEKRSAHKIIKSGAVFYGNCVSNDGGSGDVAMEITNVNGSEFSGRTWLPSTKDVEYVMKGHFDWDSNKIWFDEYLQLPAPWDELSLCRQYVGEIKSDGINGFWNSEDYSVNGTFELYARRH